MSLGFTWRTAVFLLPALLIYAVFSAVPLMDTLRLGLYAADDTGARHFVGLAQYATILGDPQWSQQFWNAMWNNLKFFAIHLLVQNPIGLLLAALLSLRDVRGAATYRTLFFLPTLLSVVIVGFVWQLILSPLWGVSETVLGWVGLQDWFEPWLGLEGSALVTISLMSVWYMQFLL